MRARRVIDDFGSEPPGFLRLALSATEFVLAARHRADELEPLRRIEMKASMRRSLRALGLRAEGRAEEGLDIVRSQDPHAEGISFGMMAEAQLLETLGRFAELSALCTKIRVRAERIDCGGGAGDGRPAGRVRLLAEGDPARAAELAGSSVDRFAAVGADCGGGGLAAHAGRGAAGPRPPGGGGGRTRSRRARVAPGGWSRRARAVRRAPDLV